MAYRELAQPRTPALNASRALERFAEHDHTTLEANERRKRLSKNPANDPTVNPLARRPPTTVPRVGEWAIGNLTASAPALTRPKPAASRPATALPAGFSQGVRAFPERARVEGSVAAKPSRVARARASSSSLGLGETIDPFATEEASSAAGLSASASLSQLSFGTDDLRRMTPVHKFRPVDMRKEEREFFSLNQSVLAGLPTSNLSLPGASEKPRATSAVGSVRTTNLRQIIGAPERAHAHELKVPVAAGASAAAVQQKELRPATSQGLLRSGRHTQSTPVLGGSLGGDAPGLGGSASAQQLLLSTAREEAEHDDDVALAMADDLGGVPSAAAFARATAEDGARYVGATPLALAGRGERGRKQEPGFFPLPAFDDLTFEHGAVDAVLKRAKEQKAKAAKGEDDDAATAAEEGAATLGGGLSRYRGSDGMWMWAECDVVAYDEETQLFDIRWRGGEGHGKGKRVSRLNLMLDGDDPALFLARIEAARKLRQQSEAALRQNARLQQLSAAKGRLPSQALQLQVLKRVGEAKPLTTSSLETLLSEFHDSYRTACHAVDMAAELPYLERHETAGLPPPPPTRAPPPPARECGTVACPPHDFKASLASLSRELPAASSSVLGAMLDVRAEVGAIGSLPYLASPSSSPQALEAFVAGHSQALASSLVKVRQHLSMIKELICAEYNGVDDRDRAAERPRFEKAITVANQMARDALRSAALEALNELVARLRAPPPQTDTAGLRACLAGDVVHEGSLFLITLVCRDGGAIYAPPVAAYANACEGLVRELVEKLGEVAGVPLHALPTPFKPGAPPEEPPPPPPLMPLQLGEVEVVEAMRDVRDAVGAHAGWAAELAALYAEHVPALLQDKQQLVKTLAGKAAGLSLQAWLGAYRDELSRLRGAAAQVEAAICLANEVQLGLYCVQLGRFKESLVKRAAELEAHVCAAVAEDAKNGHKATGARFGVILETISKAPTNVEELTAQREYLAGLKTEMEELEDEIATGQAKLGLLDEFGYSVADSEFSLACSTRALPTEVERAMMANEEILMDNNNKFMEELQLEQEAFVLELQALAEQAAEFKQFSDVDGVEARQAQVIQTQESLDAAKERGKLINSREALFGWPVTQYDQIRQVQKDLQPYVDLWTTAYEFMSALPIWLDGSFIELDPQQVEDQVTGWTRTLKKLRIGFEDGKLSHPLSVCENMLQRLANFETKLPIVTRLRNPGLRERHWEAISEKTGIKLRPDPALTLTQLVELDVSRWDAEIEAVSVVATQEYSLEKALDKMVSEWKPLTLDTVAYKETGTHVLRAMDDILQLLDDQIVKTQTMRGSPFIKPFEERVGSWERQLINMQEIFDEWLSCQKVWLYLEPIFGSDDIMRQMPTEGRRFAAVDALWRKTMALAVRTPSVLRMCSTDKLLEKFREANKFLEMIQKGLNEYLDTKRLAFPRFYFLSNDELLEILSQTKNPLAVQPHLAKCFEGIHRLDFSDTQLILAMKSPEGERVQFVEKLDPNEGDKKGNVEKWLVDVEEVMRESLRQIMRDAVAAYPSEERATWVLEWPGQVVLNGSQVFWTLEVERAINGGVDKLAAYKAQLDAQLQAIVAKVRGDLSKLHRQTMGALVTIDVHQRDVIEELVTLEVAATDQFDWAAQLRYYWDAKELAMTVRMMNAHSKYDFEYLGNSGRLVITPLTDRCYRTLMGAVHLVLGGAPEGPAGTGKTETTKDLAKALAKMCVVYNCSDALDYLAMAKFFKGLAASGGWACFDEFNRISLEVLSVVAQQVLTIQRAIADTSKARFMFEGTDLPINRACAVFITMNPGYAGRSDLPDNLKSLFRSCAMMVPSYAMIAEISLYSYGFVDPRTCAQKIVACLRLCSEQLSSQDHYDYGMRAVKTIIVAAGNLKRATPDEAEDVLTLRAIRDCNVPKFLQADLPLFDGITQDLFPETTLPDADYGSLLSALKESCAAQVLQPVPTFLKKCIQLYETILVRHGLMTVGATFSGKSEVRHCLQRALTELKGTDEKYEGAVKEYVINPKSIKMGELYGCFDDVSHEWSDGVLAVTYRNAAQNTSTDRQWVVFDGPVDAVWIENMNTVLDDNKKLCLMSGEIIKMSPYMSMMFEVEDLSVASPATVSRVGIVYLEPAQLGWHALVASWLAQLPEELAETRPAVQRLFDALVEPSLKCVRAECREMVPTDDLMLVNSLCRLLEALMTPPSGWGPIRDGSVQKPRAFDDKSLGFVFSLALVWTVGGTIDLSSRPSFEQMLRDLEPKTPEGRVVPCLNFPEHSTVWDVTYDKQGAKWVPWLSGGGSEYAIREKASFHEITVPTVDSARVHALLGLLLARACPVLFVGPTGTGKSVTVNQHLARLDAARYSSLGVTFSAQTTARQTQQIIEAKLDRRRKGVLGPPFGMRCVVFVDDLNMPAKEVYGAQPPIELLRQWMDHGGWYDTAALSFKQLIELDFVAAMGPPGGGRNPITSRYLRHYNVVAVTDFSDESLQRIFVTIMEWFLASFPPIKSMARAIVAASVDVYKRAMAGLLPTPAKSHYTFNLRDLCKVFQGVLMTSPELTDSPEKMARLWVHECCRVFQDRLVTDDDREWLTAQLQEVTKERLRLDWAQVMPEGRRLVFSSLMVKDVERRRYEEVESEALLKARVEEYLNEYNSLTNRPMRLVMFMAAIEHVARIARVVGQPFGNALLIGVGGSGRQSLSRLAAYIQDFEAFQIEITRQYGMAEWRDDMKALLRKGGRDGKSQVFIFTDSQLKLEAFLEDINNILNKGEIPSLYAPDELEAIFAELRPLAREQDRDQTTPALWAWFIERCRMNVHVALCMSPIGEGLRTRLRQFPSLINCTTIDWFDKWPTEALQAVAYHALGQLPDVPGKTLDGVVSVCISAQQSVVALSERFQSELRRVNYVTPTLYLNLLALLQSLLLEKRKEVSTVKNRYEVGLSKLLATAQQVADMQSELEALKPQLIIKSAEADEMMVVITRDRLEADQTKSVVEKEEKECTEKAEEAQELKDSCEKDLAEALPALNAALKALKGLSKNDIIEVKSMKSPPAGVKLTMETVCIMKGVKPTKVAAPDGRGKVDDYWEPAKKMMNDTQFLNTLFDYDKDNIPDAVVEKVRPYLDDPTFDPDVVAKSSQAAMGLCKWVRAMMIYNQVAKVVGPKRAALKQAEATVAEATALLKEKKDALQAIIDKLSALEKQYEATIEEKASLEAQVDDCTKRLDRAQRLIGGLGGEKTRWTQRAAELGDEYNSLLGDVSVCAAMCAYLGPFTMGYRTAAVNGWRETLQSKGIQLSQSFSLLYTLGDPVRIREWKIHGLPSDSFSVDNGIIMARSSQWPLLIDPQGQANKWVKNMERQRGLRLIKLSDSDFLRTLENAVQFGTPVLCENVGEELDPALEPLLAKQTYPSGGVMMIKLGDSEIEFSSNFMFYISTKLANPHYMPEISTKVVLLNFTITQEGLEDQMLGIVVAKERPDLEQEKNALIIEGAAMAKELKGIEDKILELLSNASGNILDDEELIHTLSESKVKSTEIERKRDVAAQTERTIDETRQQYRPVAFRSSTMFFCIADLNSVDPMYAWSMPWYVALFERAIDEAEKSEVLLERLTALMDQFTFMLYRAICRSLFEKDKLLFSLTLCVKILQGDGLVDLNEWRFLLTGGVALSATQPPNPTQWLPDKAWLDLCVLSELPAFAELPASVGGADEGQEWRAWYDAPEPQTLPSPGAWQEALSSFQRLLLLRCMRPDKCVPAISSWVAERMGQRYVEPPPFDLAECFGDASASTPLIFILSAGADPIDALLKFAEARGYSRRLQSISLGQGQGPIAERMITDALQKGGWVVLQNCHLAPSWMGSLERICEELTPERAHADFRLWLTSKPASHFPVAVLQNGVKMTNEPPKGLRANLMGSFLSRDDEFFESCPKPAAIKKLFFGLAFFHALIQERRKFGALGWNIPYEFNESDLRICVRQLHMFLTDFDEIAYKALSYMAGELNYGGRVTDDKDRRLCACILQGFYSPAILDDEYRFSPSGQYYAPPEGDVESYRAYIRELPLNDPPEVFGLHANADITCARKETTELLTTVLSLQPRAAGGGGATTEELVERVASDIEAKVPQPFAVARVMESYPTDYLESMNTVLVQELVRFNRLIVVVRASLSNIKKALKGLVVMSADLEQVSVAMNNGQVPAMWAKKAYPSLKPLASWVADLLARLQFFQTWIDAGKPSQYWISGFFFTQSFITGTLQNYARRHKVAIDTLRFDFDVLSGMEVNSAERPDDGCYVYGLYLEGCRWDGERGVLGESQPKILFTEMPVIWLKPTTAAAAEEGRYDAPVYKTSARRGTLSTTGHSTNFVLFISLPSQEPEAHWVKRSVALLCSLDD